jgi:hypothetical protein
MKTSLKSFAAFVVAVGISTLGPASPARAATHGSSSGSSHGQSSQRMVQGEGRRSPDKFENRDKFDKHDSYRFDHTWDRDYCRYGCYPWNHCSYGYCNPCYSCYQPSYCCEYCNPPCCQYCPPSPPVCCPQPCYSYCQDYCDYCFPGYHGRSWWDKYDHYKDYDFRKHDRDGSRHEEHPLTSQGRTNHSGQVASQGSGSRGARR